MFVLGINIALWIFFVVVFLVLCVIILSHHTVQKEQAIIFVFTGIVILVVQALGITYMVRGVL